MNQTKENPLTWRCARMGLLVFTAIALASGCTKAIRGDAVKVATAGTNAAQNVGDYYSSLEGDVSDSWKFYTFAQGYNFPPPHHPLTDQEKQDAKQRADLEKELHNQMGQLYAALEARRQLAGAMSETYAKFTDLANYDSPSAVNDAADSLLQPAQKVLNTPFPAAISMGGVTSALLTPMDLIHAFVTELETQKQNAAIRKSSAGIMNVVKDYQAMFTAELPVYQFISKTRQQTATIVLQELLEGGSLTAHDALQNVVEGSGLDVSQSVPITDKNVIGGIERYINERNNPFETETLSDDAGNAIDKSLNSLVKMHQQLNVRQRPSLNEFMNHSAIAKKILDALQKSKNGEGAGTQNGQ